MFTGYLNHISDTEIYSFVTDEKSGCSTHCPINKGPCKYYNSITNFCRIHCSTDCLFTPRDQGKRFASGHNLYNIVRDGTGFKKKIGNHTSGSYFHTKF